MIIKNALQNSFRAAVTSACCVGFLTGYGAHAEADNDNVSQTTELSSFVGVRLGWARSLGDGTPHVTFLARTEHVCGPHDREVVVEYLDGGSWVEGPELTPSFLNYGPNGGVYLGTLIGTGDATFRIRYYNQCTNTAYYDDNEGLYYSVSWNGGGDQAEGAVGGFVSNKELRITQSSEQGYVLRGTFYCSGTDSQYRYAYATYQSSSGSGSVAANYSGQAYKQYNVQQFDFQVRIPSRSVNVTLGCISFSTGFERFTDDNLGAGYMVKYNQSSF